ncbi:hypothetical protein J6590_052432 [Homalodisca vitripennis]|nr:hypothetical protein J6590_052432 [Homalodisca vitripennis]
MKGSSTCREPTREIKEKFTITPSQTDWEREIIHFLSGNAKRCTHFYESHTLSNVLWCKAKVIDQGRGRKATTVEADWPHKEHRFVNIGAPISP